MINVFLGSITSLDPVDFSQVVHLGITIDADNNPATSDPEMMPRQMIIPAFWAKNAEKLAGQDWTPIFGVNSPLGELPASKIQTQGITTDRIATNAITTDKIAPGAIQTSDIGDGQITVEKLAPSFQLDTVIPPGTIQAFGGPNPPNGWLLCDGRPLYATNYPQLFAAIGTAWGGGYTNGVPQGNFNLPDLRGRFLRGVSGETTRDPDRNLRTATQLGGNVGNVVGSDQGDATRRPNSEFTTSTDGAHTHLLERASSGTQIRWGDGGGYSSNAIDAGDGVSEGTSGVPRARSAGSHSHTISGGGDLETRPKNAYVHFIIKY
ncbi:MAG: tail fiber protein [Verrucomicrobia bacterium]|nr:tail fiber protein [Verrucomicrobiota bacterium]